MDRMNVSGEMPGVSNLLTPEDRETLRRAKALLERPSLAARLTDLLGRPIEAGFAMLPERWSEMIHQAVHNSLSVALKVATRSLRRRSPRRGSDRLHRIAVIASGATGGAMGLPGLALELPVSTTLMLRSIADIATREGEDLTSHESRLACLEVFALGGRGPSDDAAETGYFAIRSALARSVSEAARYLAERGLAEEGAPALVRFLSAIAARFGTAVSEKAAAAAVPVIGAAGGAVINSIFMRHFQDMARGHFTVRRLERIYGPDVIRAEYQRLRV